MPKQKTIPELKAEFAASERQLAQLRHKQQQLENRRSYYEKGDRRKRAHRLITRGAAIESVAPLAKALSETEFYSFVEKSSPCRMSRPCSWKPSTNTTVLNTKGGSNHRIIPFSCDPDQAQRRTVCRSCCRLSFRRKAAQRVLRRGHRLHPQGRCDLL